MSGITSHVLDISTGKPAEGVNITLYNSIEKIATSVTDSDGRLTDFFEKNVVIEKGMYTISFDTGNYFEVNGVKSIYPFVEISFIIDTDENYHIPLLISPFGFTTYRGS